MIEKKKILIRIGSLRHGGAEKVLLNFLKNIPQEKYEIDLLLNLNSGKYLSEVPSWIKVFYLMKGEMLTSNHIRILPQKIFRVLYEKLLKKFPKILYQKILKNKKYDVEFAAIHGFRDEILNSPIKTSKKIIWIHNDLRKTQFHHYTDSEIRKFFGFDKILVISKQIENDFLSLVQNDSQQKKIERIYNPLDTQEVIKKSQSSISVFDKNPKVPIFLAVGTIFPQKGFDRLIQVHHQLIQEGFLHQIFIIGDGYDMENIQQLIKDLKVENSVKMLGFISNPYPYFHQADFFILSSRYEGFPTVLFEAITLKKNIIATEVSGAREMLEDGQLGLIVENSENGIKQGMKKAILGDEIFDDFQKKLKDYNPPFTLENSVKKIMKIIDE